MFLAVTVNAAANLPIYYARGPSFQQEMKATFSSMFGSQKNNGTGTKSFSDVGTSSKSSRV